MEMMPPGAQPTTMGVWEANVAQAYGQQNKNGQGGEGAWGENKAVAMMAAMLLCR
jgi:hypothetical protein